MAPPKTTLTGTAIDASSDPDSPKLVEILVDAAGVATVGFAGPANR